MSSCFRMPVAPGTSSCLAMLVSSVTLMSLSVDELDDGGLGGSGRAGGGLGSPARLRVPVPGDFRDQSPQCIQSFAARCRYRHGGRSEHVPMVLRFRARSARDSLSILVATTFRATPRPSSQRAAAMSLSSPGCRESTSRTIARRGDRCPRSSPRRPAAQLLRRVSAAARVAVAGQVDEVERPASRPAGAALRRDAVDVREPRLARGCARARDLRSAERVDQARLADVRPPGQRHVRQAVLRDSVGAAAGGRAGDEVSGEELQMNRDSGLKIRDPAPSGAEPGRR